jgi:hypothetical protein
MTTPSYDHGASDRPLLGETIGENFNRIAAAHAGSGCVPAHRR